MNASIRTLSLLMLAMLSNCKDPGIQGTESSLRFQPDHVAFPDAWADQQVHATTFTIVNVGKTSLDVDWTGLAPFDADLPSTLLPGENTVEVRFTATAPQVINALITVSATEVNSVTLTLTAKVKATPPCTNADACSVARFDFVSETCVQDPVPDGATCEPGTLCQVNSHCEGGRCVGEAKVCADENACTIDVCYPNTGCEFLPAPPCPGDGVCMEGVCDPASGCGVQPRADGASCGGSTTSCTEVEVCIAGTCVNRDPPDGYVCKEASPCQLEARCLNDVCTPSQPLANSLTASWSRDTQLEGDPDAGVFSPVLHDFVLEENGLMSLSGFFASPSVLRANGADPHESESPSRRCILWNEKYVCADYPWLDFINGKVSTVNLSTGATGWTLDIANAAPQFTPLVSNIFLARLVVQDSDRLAAIFEAYPPVPTNGLCRKYFLTVMDAAGNLIQAQQVTDPLLDACNHPHPYGVAADSQGNLFIAFSPTQSDSAPLVPANTTLIMSYSRDGIFRWKRVNVGMRGGELAVARGLLYSEYTTNVVEAVSGVPQYALPVELGRAVVSNSRLIPAPVQDARVLRGFEAGQALQRWATSLPGNSVFWSEQVRLAKWQTSKGAKTIALTWTVDRSVGLRPVYAMTAFDVIDGSEAFSCPVNVDDGRTPPQLFEVANGSIAMMNGAMDPDDPALPGCNKCDPPLAGSSAAFFSYPTPLLSPAVEPWVGTFGGAGHDHREN